MNIKPKSPDPRLLFWLLLAAALLIPACPAHAQSADNWPPPREKPAAEETPGRQLYVNFCAGCHGNEGQGLTNALRAQYGPDQNCAECHNTSHPNPAYAFPENAPALIGSGALLRFVTAKELSETIQTSMPWWDTGGLSPAQTTLVTEYLLHENNVLAAGVSFDTRQAGKIPLHIVKDIDYAQTTNNPSSLLLAGLIGLAAFSLLTYFRANPATQPKSGARPSFFHHLHPPRIPAAQARWRYTLGAGGLAIFLAIIVGLTGILEMFFYIPTPEQAGQSIQLITYLVPFGSLIRGLHFWDAQALVVVSVVHLLRVIFTGAFHLPRRFNFLIGLALLVVLLFLNFTGYILRWDEGIHWALVVGTNLLRAIPGIGDGLYRFVVGGQVIGASTLTRFYAWHIFGLTLIGIILIGWHIFRVRRDGGINSPSTNRDFINRFALVRREVLAMLAALAALVILASLLPAPIAAPIIEGAVLPPDVRAPWFFLWVQQLLRYGDAFLMGLGIPLVMLFALAAMPYILPAIPDEQKGRWFPRAGRIAQIVTALFALAWLTLTLLELLQ